MSKQRGLIIFIILVISILLVRTLQYSNVYIALVCSIGDILISIIIGRVILWLFEKIYLFFRNVINKESIIKVKARLLWETISISLAIGFPLWFIASKGWK